MRNLKRLNLGNACCHSVQKLLSCLLLTNMKMFICKTLILPVVLYWHETYSRTLRDEHRLRMLRRILGTKRDEI
jgi:hypothetical protein